MSRDGSGSEPRIRRGALLFRLPAAVVAWVSAQVVTVLLASGQPARLHRAAQGTGSSVTRARARRQLRTLRALVGRARAYDDRADAPRLAEFVAELALGETNRSGPLALASVCLIGHTVLVRIGELLRATRERHGLTQARLARRIGADRGYVSRVERGQVSPTFDWAERAFAAMGEELALGVRRSRFDDHDPTAHRIVGGWDPDRRLDDFVASAEVLDQLARSGE